MKTDLIEGGPVEFPYVIEHGGTSPASGHHRLTIDPAAANARAIAACGKAGFRPVGTMWEDRQMTDGPWVDALRMDRSAHELVR